MNLCMLRALLLAAVPCVSTADAQVIYVDAAATGANDGSSWTDAFVDLQVALSAATSGEIWVANGTYRTGGPGTPRSVSFALKNGVALFGGFDGDESATFQRNPFAKQTILSGDVNGDDQSDWVNHYENAYRVVTAAGCSPSTIIDGFVIRGGTNEPGAVAGLDFQGGTPTFRNLTFRDCLASNSAAMAFSSGTWLVDHCDFERCYGWVSYGGAVSVTTGAAVTFDTCEFRENTSASGGGYAGGGAIHASSPGALTIKKCTFLKNVATYPFGGPGPTSGGALVLIHANALVVDCFFGGNRAHNGGAVWAGNDNTFVNCVFSGNVAESAGVWAGSGYGGAVYAFFGTNSFTSCTFSKNTAGEEGGGLVTSYGPANLRNSIVWGNVGNKAQDPLSRNLKKFDPSGSASITWSCVEGLLFPIPGEDPPDPSNYPGSIDANPVFVDADGADNVVGTIDDALGLGSGSPCIDAGRNSYVVAGQVSDHAGQPRIVDDSAKADTGNGTAPFVDMGAFERLATALVAYGTGTPGCAGTHSLWASPTPRVNTPTFAFTCDHAPPASLGWGLISAIGDLGGSDPTGFGITFHVGFGGPFLMFPIASDANGNALVPAPIPNLPTIAGATIYVQALWTWTTCSPTGPGVSSSRGLKVTFGA